MCQISNDWTDITEDKDAIKDGKRYFLRTHKRSAYVFEHHEGSWPADRVRRFMNGYYTMYLLKGDD